VADKYENKEKGGFDKERSFDTIFLKKIIPSKQSSPHNLGTYER
jgi:hypothetical protein